VKNKTKTKKQKSKKAKNHEEKKTTIAFVWQSSEVLPSLPLLSSLPQAETLRF